MRRGTNLGRRDDDGAVDAGFLEELRDGQVLVRGARRRVDDQVVQAAPVDVLEELFDQACGEDEPA